MKIKEYKEMMAYLTRPKDSLKEIFKNKKNKKPIDARTASLNKVSDTQVPPKNTFEQQIINKTKELSEDKITTKRPIVKDHITKQLINANNTFDGGPYIVDNETGEVVSEAELKRRFTYQDKPYPKQATKKQMDELTTRVKKYVDVHGSKPFKKKVTAPEVEIKIPEFDPNLFKRPVRDPGSDRLEKRYNEIVRQQEEEKRRNRISGIGGLLGGEVE